LTNWSKRLTNCSNRLTNWSKRLTNWSKRTRCPSGGAAAGPARPLRHQPAARRRRRHLGPAAGRGPHVQHGRGGGPPPLRGCRPRRGPAPGGADACVPCAREGCAAALLLPPCDRGPCAWGPVRRCVRVLCPRGMQRCSQRRLADCAADRRCRRCAREGCSAAPPPRLGLAGASLRIRPSRRPPLTESGGECWPAPRRPPCRNPASFSSGSQPPAPFSASSARDDSGECVPAGIRRGMRIRLSHLRSKDWTRPGGGGVSYRINLYHIFSLDELRQAAGALVKHRSTRPVTG
jgi:hypothetical protein